MKACLSNTAPSLLFRLGQMLWGLILVSSMFLLAVAIPARFAQLNRVAPRLDVGSGTLSPVEVELLSQVGISLSHYAGYITLLEALTSLTGLVVGAIIFWRKRDDWMAMFSSIALLTLGTFPTPLMTSVLDYQPGLAPLLTFLQFVGIGPSLLILYVFPDGRFVPGWTRVPALIWMAYSIAWLFLPALKPPLTLFAVKAMPVYLALFVLGSVSVGIYAQLHRYQHYATPIQRQQTKWIVMGFTVNLSILVGVGAVSTLFDYNHPTPTAMLFLLAGITAILFGLSIPPIAVMISILQFRLWDIDLIIRRTLQYSVLSGLLAFVYFSLIVLLQSFFTVLTGQRDNPFITVLSTLAIAALFFPLRKRVQDFIDRRFFRQKYDAAKSLADSAATARDETDLDKLTARLVEVVDETMQPESVGLWLKPTTDPIPAFVEQRNK